MLIDDHTKRTSRLSASQENEALARYCQVPAHECPSSSVAGKKEFLVPGEAVPCAGGPERTHRDFSVLRRETAGATTSLTEAKRLWQLR
jgi:hypothetical protein